MKRCAALTAKPSYSGLQCHICPQNASLGKQLGKKALEEVASIVMPDIILTWYRKLVVQKPESPVFHPH